ncbi:MAG: radical SAM family heme chaperone HemW [Candidatus Marinimicrobia bacterium]|jgi:oxygen-independent coproporphyrinogen-3 oxidase|nr:radical SAM family heme chaperone HemW [Candidatus Neomarinimicrobiota bacterium]MBT3502092.1 radical SAM family heme chaperone HemW [Candidatus Neomarinimicrobiota bacterium]MBT3840465.1 radical SAM family heme chaperone HemW [Candidatus Neomarinimicrobiota bacterium]MBT3999981.1 radical SAM family heme chaperone HemW [Candidatus Neomarinimicrobiota bacterium]MBT4283516.1 radical SAM family heme chaperone HemW [Candidatus Neomarinimicrobiota bacterium]
MKTPAGIYIHIPFCAIKCMYCDFYSIAEKEDAIPRFVKTIVSEIEQCNVDTTNWNINTIFIGGGTPSLLDSEHIEIILKALQTKYDLSQLSEFTIEANPGEAPKNRLIDFRSLGINRLSIGVQSLEPDILRFLTRIHTVEQVFETFENARSARFDNVNCDLIYSIPGQSWDIWNRDLNKILDLGPEHISAYTLTLEKGTNLFKLVKGKQVKMPNDDKTSKWFLKTHEIFDSRGYPSYEISNFSLRGFECLHNLHYWKIYPYLAFGPSAHGFDGKNRWSNIRHLDGYMDKIESNKSPITFRESLTENQIQNEKIGFGLRMAKGINEKLVDKDILKKAIQKWPNCIHVQNHFIQLTQNGLVFADAISVDLML